jgi:CrcB protein
MKAVLIVGLGGALGSIGRYLLQLYADRHLTLEFPVGTYLVNVSGCFLIGLFFGLSHKYDWINIEWRLFLVTGICGGFTTFSSFAYESVGLFREGAYAYFILYVLGSVILGVLATAAGMAVIR